MAAEREALRDWHRLFGLLLTDFFAGSPFTVDIERDLSQQQQLLDVVIVRRGRGRFAGRLPDGLEGLAAHNLITFKSHREALDAWALKELIHHYVAYRKLVSPAPSDLLPEEDFRLYAVCARYPHNLSGQVPWQERQAGVYDCRWGTDTVRVVVAGQLPREPHNAPLHLFSASQELVGFAQGAYRRRSETTSEMLRLLFVALQGEDVTMSYTMEDFKRDYPEMLARALRALPPEKRLQLLQELTPEEHKQLLRALRPEEGRQLLRELTPEEHQQLLQALPPEERLAGLSAEQIREYLDRLTAERPARPRKPRRKK